MVIIIYIYFLVFQFLNTYLGVLSVFNPYAFCLFFTLLGLQIRTDKISKRFFLILILFVVFFIIVYSFKFSFVSSFGTTAKALQFNFGYLFLIPGFAFLFKFDKGISLEKILSSTFWILTVELFMEFILIRIVGISPDLFQHYPKINHIRIDELTGAYVADRMLGLTGNASVMGVFFVSVFSMYMGRLMELSPNKITLKMRIAIIAFLCCFFMITSGSAFLAILASFLVIWASKKGNLIKNLILVLIILPVIALFVNYLDVNFNLFNGKFKFDYLIFLLSNNSIEGSLPYLLRDMSKDYNWYDIFFGKYYFEWGNPDAVIKTVDYFYINLVYEFGIFGLIVFLYIIKIAYDKIAASKIVSSNYLKFAFLVLVFGSLHYPAIVYMAPQVFISAVTGFAINYLYTKNMKKKYEEILE
ncbi:hypothetical protein ACR782_02585 [Sphingobacterium spiritivorum]|uniref:hypothetical protein n=1 Tax=Sphingobacterium spiritivorum TaxID=258 RepID=UPI003DA22433